MHPAQALVEQCSAAGRPEQVERCVLHMDVASLDFSQVRCCERSHTIHTLCKWQIRCIFTMSTVRHPTFDVALL